jgi:hypothetical protein
MLREQNFSVPRATHVVQKLWLIIAWLVAISAVVGDDSKVVADDSKKDNLSSTEKSGNNFSRDRLVAWCIVPFDAAHRGPEERAAMVARLGLRRVAYDWREEHVRSFEEEILAYQRHGLEYFAFWDEHEAAFQLFEKYHLTPQIWKMIPAPQGTSEEEKVASAAKQLMPLVERTRKLGSKLGLYNHGGWMGEPETMVAVCRWLREHAQADHVGIVYNFHHGHEHMARFSDSLQRMLPYLLCVNINGMHESGEPKIAPIGSGQREVEMLRIVKASGYQGPIGILHHREQIDAEQGLRENLVGLRQVLHQLHDTEALASFEKE